MTKEDKELLLKDLCARLPYGVRVTWDGKHSLTVTSHIYCAIESEDNLKNLPKILLRSMSSMTEEEKKEFHHVASLQRDYIGDDIFYTHYQMYDWFNKKGFDYRGLIEKGLAIEAPEGMYN